MSVHTVDQEARDMARDAMAVINGHEKICAERWESARKAMADIKSILAYGTAGLISAMAALIGWLATHPPH